MNLYVSTVVQFVPDFSADERINIGVIVGSNEAGFKAAWRPERALIFGLKIDTELSAWIEKEMKPLSVERLVYQTPFRKINFQLTPLRPIMNEAIEGALEIMTSTFLKTNEEYQARWT